MRKLLVSIAAIALAGCGTTGSTFRFEQRRNVGMTSVQVGGYDVPVLSISEGPSATAFQSREAYCVMRVSGTATTTNTTSALGIYSSTEEKKFSFDGTFITCSTNVTDLSFTTNIVPSSAYSENSPTNSHRESN